MLISHEGDSSAAYFTLLCKKMKYNHARTRLGTDLLLCISLQWKVQLHQTLMPCSFPQLPCQGPAASCTCWRRLLYAQLLGLKQAKESVRGEEKVKVNELTISSRYQPSCFQVHTYAARWKQSQHTPPIHHAHQEGLVSGSKSCSCTYTQRLYCFRLKLAPSK